MFSRARLADIMENEGKRKISWYPGGEAEKYKEKFWPVFGRGKWSWCAATVTWACEQAGLVMPVKCPSKFGYTFALVEGWQQWAIEKGLYFDNDGKFKPQRGDISVFDWTQTNIYTPDADWENHIGVHLVMDGENYLSAEGNTDNRTGIKTRTPRQVQGWIRIPDGYSFSGTPPPPSLPPLISKKGDRGSEVGDIQSALIKYSLKFHPGDVDNMFGPKTEAAVINFQKTNDIAPTGQVGEDTRIALGI